MYNYDESNVSYEEHQRLFSENSLRLGRTLGHLLAAQQALENRMFTSSVVKKGFTRPDSTEFGKEVGKDEIHWWIYKKESDLEGLRARVTAALEAAQTLKQESVLATSNIGTDRDPRKLLLLRAASELPEGPVVASTPFDRLDLHLPSPL